MILEYNRIKYMINVAFHSHVTVLWCVRLFLPGLALQSAAPLQVF